MTKIWFIFKRDSDNSECHCWNHHRVTPSEAIETWYKGAQNESTARYGSLFRWATIKNGRTIRVVWRWLKIGSLVAIDTAYDYNPESKNND